MSSDRFCRCLTTTEIIRASRSNVSNCNSSGDSNVFSDGYVGGGTVVVIVVSMVAVALVMVNGNIMIILLIMARVIISGARLRYDITNENKSGDGNRKR